MNAYYVYCVDCKSGVEISNLMSGRSAGRRVFSTLEKAKDFIREHVLSWYEEKDITTNPQYPYEWMVKPLEGCYIWGIEEVTIL